MSDYEDNDNKTDDQSDLTMEEIVAVETGNYYIQIGTEVYVSESGKMAFSKARAEKIYKDLYDGLVDLKANGNYEDIMEADFCLRNFNMHPLRIH